MGRAGSGKAGQVIQADRQLHRRAGQAYRLVWALAVLGVLICVFTTIVVKAAINTIRTQRVESATMQDAIESLSVDQTAGFTNVQNEMRSLLDARGVTLNPVDTIQRMQSAVGKFMMTSPDQKWASSVENIRDMIDELEQLRIACEKWHVAYKQSLADLDQSKKQTDNQIVRMRAMLSSAEGRQRLGLISIIRDFRKANVEESKLLADAILRELGLAQQWTELPVEISSLGMYSEKLIAEDELDELADLRENLIVPSLFRVKRTVAHAEDSFPRLSQEIKQVSNQLQESLLGKGCVLDDDQQSIIAGEGGLLAAARRRLELRKSRETLRSQIAQKSVEFKSTFKQLDVLSDGLKQSMTAGAEDILMRSQRNLMIGSVVSVLILIVLGRKIADIIRRQIRLITHGTTNLARSNAQMAAIHRTVLDGVIVVDQNWMITEFNPAAERAFDSAQSDVLGRTLEELVQFDRAAVEEDESGLGQHRRLTETTAFRADGTRFVVEMAVTRAQISGPCLRVITLRDLTERKKAEADKEELHGRLLSASRHAGMAEVATGVLHNVGNVLNSVNVSANVIATKLRESEMKSLGKVSELIQGQQGNIGEYLSSDARGRLIPGFIVELSQCLSREQEEIAEEMDALARGVEHIKQIVQAQQGVAKRGPLRMPCDAAKLFESAIAMQSNLRQDGGIRIARQFAAMDNVMLAQHRVTQILVNLIGNAAQSVHGKKESGPTIVLRLEQGEQDGVPSVRFIVKDNGMGIEQENLTRIFAHGFTTKKEGHGFGLHSAANAAREMDGRLSASSNGAGQGAEFVLEIPTVCKNEGVVCN